MENSGYNKTIHKFVGGKQTVKNQIWYPKVYLFTTLYGGSSQPLKTEETDDLSSVSISVIGYLKFRAEKILF